VTHPRERSSERTVPMERIRLLLRRLRARRHTVLLGAIVAAFAVRPLIGDHGAGPVVFSLALLVLLLVGLYTIQVDDMVGERDALRARHHRRHLLGWALAVLALIERLLPLLYSEPWLLTAGAVSWMLFFALVTWSQLQSVLRQKEVTGETLSSSISVYLLAGVVWSLLYTILFRIQDNAFAFGSTGPPTQLQTFEVFIYFSLTCLSTIGFGDITPLTLQARYAAVAEGIIGQFYLTIIVARLVGLQMSRAQSLARPGGDVP